MVHIEIDGIKLEVPQGAMIIEVADEANIVIPRFCYHKKLSIAANCRMCLVHVENAPKPLPACATPVSEGMKIFTQSKVATDAQKSVMEFLLINHPLDCPICDQGGQCELQDVAMSYGQDVSQFTERKRVVKDKDLGPLISTDMTRCIHCTRCVRFGDEVAGLRELGAPGRGEHTEIGTYIESSVDSEVSGNVIDLCPVGALTSKPFRFKARAWEVMAKAGVSPHDSLGSNLYYHLHRGEIVKVVPKENEEVNEVWLSDRDRFSYQAVNSSERLLTPKIKQNGQWLDVDWPTALSFAKDKLEEILDNKPGQLGVLASPNSTLEEFYLLQKIFKAKGCNNVDHRLRCIDTKHHKNLGSYPSMGIKARELEEQDLVILIGCDIRKEQPLLATRLRKATSHGSQVLVINPLEVENNFDVAATVVGEKADIQNALLQVLKAANSDKAPQELTKILADVKVGESANQFSEVLSAAIANNAKISVVMGAYAWMHPHASVVYWLGRQLANISNATWGELSGGANSAGAWLAGAVSQKGLSAYEMCQSSLKGYLLFNCEPEFDCAAPRLALESLYHAQSVVVLSAFDNKEAREYADVMLPITPVTETQGTYVNLQGDWQQFYPAAKPQGDSKPAWKVLRVLGDLLNVTEVDYENINQLRDELNHLNSDEHHFKENLLTAPAPTEIIELNGHHQLIRIAPTPIYAQDNITRRSEHLQKTKDAQHNVIKINANESQKLNLKQGDLVTVSQDGKTTNTPLAIVIDNKIPDGAVLLAGSLPETIMLGAPYGVVELAAGARG